jgi:putative phage-type endonuclease
MSLTAEQLEARKRGVGGSEILAALGKDSRCSRLELYKRKVGEMPEPNFADNERVYFGQLLEPVIREEFSRRTKQRVIVPAQTLFHPTAPLLGHPDGWMPAIREGVEIKMADKYEAEEFGEEDSDQVPVRYLVQCAAYMALTNADWWQLCVLIGGNDLRIYRIPRDPEIEAAVIAGASEFWSHVETRTAPDPQTPEEVRMRWPKDTGSRIAATEEMQALCVELKAAKSLLKSAAEREDELKAQIQRFMGEHADLHAPGALKPLATWRTAKPSLKFDEARFAARHPRVHAKYQREVSGSRRFLLK